MKLDVAKCLKWAYGESAMSKTRFYEWYKRFQEVKQSIWSATYKLNAVYVNQSEKSVRIYGKTNCVCEFLTKHNNVMMPQPPFSPDMAVYDFFLFPKINRALKDCRFASINSNKCASLKELEAIPKINFKKCFYEWKKR